MKKCKVEGCDSPHHAKGYCGKHHKSFIRYGDPLKAKTILERNMFDHCAVPGCDRPYSSLGFCRAHVRKFQKTGEFDLRRFVVGGADCKAQNCNLKAIGKGYCMKHYYRFKRNGNPMIIKNTKGKPKFVKT